MDKSWNATGNYSETQTGRFLANDTGSNPPNMLRGALYAALHEDNRLFTFGGSSFVANTSDPDWEAPRQDDDSLWSYDIVSSSWRDYDITSAIPRRPNWGAVGEDMIHEFGFFLNGQFDRGSSLGRYDSVEYEDGNPTNATFDQITYLSGMLVLDLGTASARNVSTETLGSPRVAGGLVYSSFFGKSSNGTVIAFGGMRSGGQGDDTFTNGVLVLPTPMRKPMSVLMRPDRLHHRLPVRHLQGRERDVVQPVHHRRDAPSAHGLLHVPHRHPRPGQLQPKLVRSQPVPPENPR